MCSTYPACRFKHAARALARNASIIPVCVSLSLSLTLALSISLSLPLSLSLSLSLCFDTLCAVLLQRCGEPETSQPISGKGTTQTSWPALSVKGERCVGSS
jgi:hypothetical protein